MDITKNLNQQARIEDITLKEDFGTFVITQEDDFGDMGSFALDMDSFMMSDMEKGRRVADSLINAETVAQSGNDLDFFTDEDHLKSENNQSNELANESSYFP